MANTFYQEPIDGGDFDNWGRKDQEQPRRSIGEITCKLFDDSGTLKVKVGRVGFDNGSAKGTVYIDTETTVSLAGVSNSNWALIEISVSGTTPTIAATDLSGATDESQVYSTFTSFYDYEKGGFYVTATKRVIGLVYKDSGGNLSSILNCLNGENFLLSWDAGGTLNYVNGESLFYHNVLCFSDTKAANTSGGTGTTGAWYPRVIAQDYNTIQGGSVGSNQITLPPGRYKIVSTAPFYTVARAAIKLYDTTGTTDLILGSSTYSGVATQALSKVEGFFTLSSTSVLEVQYRIETSAGIRDLGVEGNFGVSEIYTQGIIERIA